MINDHPTTTSAKSHEKSHFQNYFVGFRARGLTLIEAAHYDVFFCNFSLVVVQSHSSSVSVCLHSTFKTRLSSCQFEGECCLSRGFPQSARSLLTFTHNFDKFTISSAHFTWSKTSQNPMHKCSTNVIAIQRRRWSERTLPCLAPLGNGMIHAKRSKMTQAFSI